MMLLWQGRCCAKELRHDEDKRTMKTSPLVKKLAKAAIRARARSYSPYSHHPVGCALLAGDGVVYSGTNCEVAHFKGICGEGAAISAMVTAGARLIRDIAVIGPAQGTDLCTPCGDCRQRIREFSDEKTCIHVLDGKGGLLRTYRLQDLLPDSFGPENLHIKSAATKNNKNKKKKTANDHPRPTAKGKPRAR